VTIHLETEIVASSYDPTTRAHSYTIERNGKRWTVSVPDADFEQFGPILGATGAVNKQRRRQHLASRLEAAMGGRADGE
jgi:hypothetical protein